MGAESTVFTMGVMGGLISLLSTSLGASLAALFSKLKSNSPRYKLSVDFTLGLMLSAAAFSLIGPAALEASASARSLASILFASGMGMLFVFGFKELIQNLNPSSDRFNKHIIFATVLMLHNFPEGLASGAALAGLGWLGSLPILGGISLQNIPEGALMVACLRAMGWSTKMAFTGGIGSGLVEMFGGILSGALLHQTPSTLPFLLSLAGGAMIGSVFIELLENKKLMTTKFLSVQFLLGLLSFPIMKLVGL